MSSDEKDIPLQCLRCQAKLEIKKDSFFVVQGYMVTDLKLKGNDLLVYAIISGFSQDNQGVFRGSLAYLAEWTNSTKQGVLKSLQSLVEKGYIVKKSSVVMGVNKVEYYATKFNTSLNKVEYPIKQCLPNNIEDNIDNKEKSILTNTLKEKTGRFVPPTIEEVKKFCSENGIKIDCEQFYYFYESAGWKRGKGTPIVNWKACVRTWERNGSANKSDSEERHGEYTDPKKFAEDWADILGE